MWVNLYSHTSNLEEEINETDCKDLFSLMVLKYTYCMWNDLVWHNNVFLWKLFFLSHSDLKKKNEIME